MSLDLDLECTLSFSEEDMEEHTTIDYFVAVTHSDNKLHEQSALRIILKVVGMSGNILSITVNLFTIAAIITERLDKKAPAHILIASLSFADFLGGISGMVTYLFNLVQDSLSKHIQNTGVWINAGFVYLVFAVSLGNTVLIGLDRFVATTFPLKYKFIITRRVTYLSLLTMWLVMIVITLVPLIYRSTQYDWSNEQLLLANFKTFQPTGYSKYVYGPFLCSLMLALCIVYSAMFFSYHKSIRRINPAITQENQNSRKLTKIFITIVTIMIICWTPVVYCIVNQPDDAGTSNVNAPEYKIFRISFLLVTVPAYANNFVYAFQHRDYKMAYLHLLKCEGK